MEIFAILRGFGSKSQKLLAWQSCHSQTEWIWAQGTSKMAASLGKRSRPKSAETRKTGDRICHGYGMHMPTYRINNWSQGRWWDQSIGSGDCTRSGFGNGWGAVGWWVVIFQVGKWRLGMHMQILDRLLLHQLLQIPSYNIEKMKWRLWRWTACCIHNRNLRHKESNTNR